MFCLTGVQVDMEPDHPTMIESGVNRCAGRHGARSSDNDWVWCQLSSVTYCHVIVSCENRVQQPDNQQSVFWFKLPTKLWIKPNWQPVRYVSVTSFMCTMQYTSYKKPSWQNRDINFFLEFQD